MMLKAGPPRSASPRPPEMATCTSDEFDMSYRYPDTPPPLPGAPTFIPSSWMRPSVLRPPRARSEEHTSELQSRPHLVCRLLLEKKKPPLFLHLFLKKKKKKQKNQTNTTIK